MKNLEFRRDWARNIVNGSLINFLTEHEVEFNAIKSDMIEEIENAVDDGTISKEDFLSFIDNEVRYGNHRSHFFVKINENKVDHLKNIEKKDLIEIIENKGYEVPNESIMLDVIRPKKIKLVELNYIINEEISLVFIETVRVTLKNNVAKENNYYFVKLDLDNNNLSIRMRPRYNVVTGSSDDLKKVQNIQLYYNVLNKTKSIFDIETNAPVDLKTTFYKIAKTLTERAEKKWKEEVEKYTPEIIRFSEEMESKLEGIKPKEFNLEFRLHRLLERALIQSNFEQLTEKEEGKIGYINSFHFSDRAGGKIKASSIEKENAIELSEIYYDTRDTIDQQKKYDLLWVNWFIEGYNLPVETKLEANSEYGLIHFYKYIREDDLDYVLSQIEHFKNKEFNE